MPKICIELEISEWDDIEKALRLAEIWEMNLVERAEAFTLPERISEWIEKHKECAGKYKNLSEKIGRQVMKAILEE